MPVETGLSAEVELLVEAADTAVAHRSGDVAVLGTPRVVGLCEQASLAALGSALSPDQTTVGMRVQIDHLAPTQVGQRTEAPAAS